MTTAPLLDQPTPATAPPTRVFAAGIALASFATLLLELALTRLFSVVLFYHFAFLAISVALLGLGAGGVFSYLRRGWLERHETRKLAAWICGLNAVAIVLVLQVVLRSSISLELNWANAGRLSVLYLASAVPFFFTGLLFSIVFARHAVRISQLYGADLIGGAAACLAVVPLLNWLGGPNAILVAALAMAVTATLWADTRRRRAAGLVLVALIALLTGANYFAAFIDIVYAKGLRRDQPWVLFSRWNAISRVEVNDQGGAKVIVIDADASTYIMTADPYQPLTGGWQKDLMRRRPRSPTSCGPGASSPSSAPAAAWTCCARSPMAAAVSPPSRSIPSSPPPSCGRSSPRPPTASTSSLKSRSTSPTAAPSSAPAATATTSCR
jgi:hypothetical protein